jgi:hypothetical protein
MPRKSKPSGPENDFDNVRRQLELFEAALAQEDLRGKVLALIPVVNQVRNLGSSLIPRSEASSAKDRILYYLRRYPRVIISGEELLVVAGISEWGRRVRELRVESGWRIITGQTVREMSAAGDFELAGTEMAPMKPDDYMLLDATQDRAAAHRWHVGNEIRKGPGGARDKILKYLRANVGEQILGEELMYVTDGKTEWARRVRELRSEFGWPVVTKTSGRPDLPIGVYVLEEDRQAPEHDRHIPDNVRSQVLMRDGYRCSNCGWTHALWNPSDPRHLELHHLQEHAKGGENTAENLLTLCSVCHDGVHAGRIQLRSLNS